LLYQWRLNGVDIQDATNEFLPYDNAQPTNGGSVTLTVGDGVEAETTVPVDFSITVSTAATGNDEFAKRSDLGTAPSGVVRSSNIGATKEPGEPDILPGNPGGKSIWFEYRPNLSGTVVFSTQGSTFDTIMGAYTGSAVNALTPVPSAINDDDAGGYLTSKVTFQAAVGTVYDIVVDGYRGASGDVVLSWFTLSAEEPIPTLLKVPPLHTVVSNGATVTFVCQPDSGIPVWFFNGEQTQFAGTNLTIESVGDTNVGYYTAQVTTGGGVAVTEPDFLETSVLQDGTSDTNSIAWRKFLDSSAEAYNPPSPQIRKLGGGDTGGFSVSQTFSTVGAPGEPGEPTIDGQIGGSPVWYSYIAPTNGTMVVSTAGSTFNTLLGVFIGPGDSFTTLTNIGAGYTTNRVLDGQPRLMMTNMPKGQTNYIVVDGYDDAKGVVHLNIALGTPAGIETPLQNQFVLAGSNATFAVDATGSTPLNYAWQFNGTNIHGATNQSLTISNAQTANTGAYTVVVTNLFGAVSNSATLALGALPEITVNPSNQTVASGSTATLEVTATAIPGPSYQWIFDQSVIGATSSGLTITNFQAANEGTYNVVVSNLFGSVISSNAILRLNAPLRLDAPVLNSSGLQLQLVGVAGGDYILETSSDLMTWIPLFTNNTPNGFIDFTDTNAPSLGLRFYRGATN
jgi:hypothetical protein